MAVAHMTALYTLAMLNDPKYRNASNSDWADNYLFGTDKEGHWRKLTAGFEPAFLFKFLPELLVRAYTGNLKTQEAGSIAWEQGKQKMLPPVIPLLPALLFEQMTGMNVNLGRSVEGAGMARLPAEFRDQNASELAKKLVEDFKLGKMGVSPVKLDALGRGLFAENYTMSAMLADLYLANMEGISLADKDITQKYPIAKAIFTNPQNQQKAPVFYEAAQAAEQMVNLIRRKGNEGDKKAFDKIMADPETQMQLGISSQLRQLRSNIEGLNASNRSLKHMKISEEEKRQIFLRNLAARQAYERRGAEIAQEAREKQKKAEKE
jgi:hypothetical protein